MANYNAFIRTNYFKVNDVDKMKNFCEKNGLEFWTENETDRNNRYGFGTYESSIDDEDIPEIQEFLEDGEICIITEVGHEKLRYLIGHVLFITKKGVESINLHEMIVAKVKTIPGVGEYVLDNIKLHY